MTTPHESAANQPSRVDFGGLMIAFDDRVLRPRQWTLAQSEWAADAIELAPDGPVLELFAGVGHIGLAAVRGSVRDLVMVDLNPAAVELARRNIEVAGMAPRVTVREGRIDEALLPHERFAVVVADPPWVPSAGISAFPDDPSIAIDGGGDGLDLARACCDVIARHLAPGGTAIVQIGTIEQAASLDDHLRSSGSVLRRRQTRTFERGVLVELVTNQPTP